MKRCERCGETYESFVEFCFNDGEVLVPVEQGSTSWSLSSLDPTEAPPPPPRPTSRPPVPPVRMEGAYVPPPVSGVDDPADAPTEEISPSIEDSTTEIEPLFGGADASGTSDDEFEFDNFRAAPNRMLWVGLAGGALVLIGLFSFTGGEPDTPPIVVSEPAPAVASVAVPKPGMTQAPSLDADPGEKEPGGEALDAGSDDAPEGLVDEQAPEDLIVDEAPSEALEATEEGVVLEAPATIALDTPAVEEPEPEPEPAPVVATKPKPAPVVVTKPKPARTPSAPVLVRPEPAPATAQPEPEPEAAPVAARSGQYTVSSVPSGAAVWIDGSRVGVTPYTGDTSYGKHEMEIRMTGYRPHVSSFVMRAPLVELPAVSLQSVLGGAVVSPKPAPAPATGSSQPAAEEASLSLFVVWLGRDGQKLRVDGAEVGTLPVMADILVGRHVFEAVGPDGTVKVTRTVAADFKGVLQLTD